MSFDPWRPPSGWDTVEAEAKVAGGSRTVRGVLGSMFDAVRRQPLAVLFAVFVFPGLWMVPATIAQDLLVSADEPAFGPGRSLRAVAVSWATGAWGSVWWAGQLVAALDAVRGQPIRWRPFLTGLAQAPLLFLTSVVLFLPLELLALLPMALGGTSASVLEVIGFLVSVYLAARTLHWAPLLVDARRPFWEGLAMSFAATRGQVSKLIALGLILGAFWLPLLVIEFVFFSEQWHVSSAVLGALYALTVAQLYSREDFGQAGRVGSPFHAGP